MLTPWFCPFLQPREWSMTRGFAAARVCELYCEAQLECDAHTCAAPRRGKRPRQWPEQQRYSSQSRERLNKLCRGHNGYSSRAPSPVWAEYYDVLCAPLLQWEQWIANVWDLSVSNDVMFTHIHSLKQGKDIFGSSTYNMWQTTNTAVAETGYSVYLQMTKN